MNEGEQKVADGVDEKRRMRMLPLMMLMMMMMLHLQSVVVCSSPA